MFLFILKWLKFKYLFIFICKRIGKVILVDFIVVLCKIGSVVNERVENVCSVVFVEGFIFCVYIEFKIYLILRRIWFLDFLLRVMLILCLEFMR